MIGNDEEDEGTAYPIGEGFTEEERWEYGESCGDADDSRGVVTTGRRWIHCREQEL